jgi:class 3 adenylate cyclase
VSVGAVFQTAGDPWVHTVIAKNADRHAEQFESDAYDEVLTVPFADPSPFTNEDYATRVA